jgi:hypothetical protein
MLEAIAGLLRVVVESRRERVPRNVVHSTSTWKKYESWAEVLRSSSAL